MLADDDCDVSSLASPRSCVRYGRFTLLLQVLDRHLGCWAMTRVSEMLGISDSLPGINTGRDRLELAVIVHGQQ